ncbi:hypothetical protein [Cupriavidus pauculus]|uniref:hypothetical protein n=1 Tax=Cupriavidus pauculus TaxID=82633 RepID=UPI001EE21AA9|nr:hypothetical protein [Cupriavidus pauculus]GJG96669.1 hypothetical protein CBA19C6_19290 [Cupriavidus pauculus]
MKARHIALGAGLLIAACLSIWSRNNDSTTIVEGTTRTRGAEPLPRSARPAPSNATDTVMALVPRDQLIGDARPDTAQGLFAVHSWAPPPAAADPSAKPEAPVAPALPFTYLGKEQSGTAWRVFLTQGDTTLVVADADSIGDQYKVVSITPPTMTFEYLPLHERQSLQIE